MIINCSSKTFIVASRGSKLALKQVDIVIEKLIRAWESYYGKSGKACFEFERKIIKTTGDKIRDVPLARIGGKGIFVKEIDEAIARGEADFAVHSMKDVPTELKEGLEIVAIPEREERNDALISAKYLGELGNNSKAIIGTSSIRRKAELLNHAIRNKKKFEIKELRGNVDTRLRKLKERQYHAIIMAKAGLKRLGFAEHIKQDLAINEFPTSVGQGAIAIVSREDFEHRDILKKIDDKKTRKEIESERALLRRIGGGCQVPLGVFTKVENGKVKIRASMFSQDGKQRIDAEYDSIYPEKAGEKAAEILLESGGEEIIRSLGK